MPHLQHPALIYSHYPLYLPASQLAGHTRLHVLQVGLVEQHCGWPMRFRGACWPASSGHLSAAGYGGEAVVWESVPS